ncbi:hypothetical protein N7447_001082 [Penicillium robsamsonii]|uniref:uncharacterized protein n=1 Tax=Penicillium robsamsonii TaxID=1792511 RepID=UPI002547E5C7|nr:uncharacterized protein N7447_001082 [Penicillium robsamsonii]KAJ5835056.1 hypothetical protein N7447_001082 [Penicillium robsamsonii]
MVKIAGLDSHPTQKGEVSTSSPSASSQVPVATATCRTELGPSSVKVVPTTTITLTGYETTIITSTADAITDIFLTTSTEFDTAALTLTPAPITTTVGEVFLSTSTSTSTIATSAGFTPIVDTLPPSVTFKRSLEENDDCSPWLDDWKYPQAVVCHVKNIIKATTVSIVIGSPITSTAVTPTTTVTITTTITSSSVVVPSDVSTTLSFSTTSTITETMFAPGETSTTTSTTTVLAGTTTTSFYAACAANNIAGSPLSSDYRPFAGKYIYALLFSNVAGRDIIVSNTDSTYDCSEARALQLLTMARLIFKMARVMCKFPMEIADTWEVH